MAEDLPEIPAAPESAPSENIVNVMNPEGRLVGLPESQVQEALQSGGYTPATQADINQAKFSSPLHQIGAVGEGIGEGIAGPLFTAGERALGVPGEDILGRREANPLGHATGQIGGLGLGLATGVGEGALLEKAGVAGSKALGLGLEGAGLASRIGSKVVTGAIENALFQAGDEGTKLLAGDPNQSTETALANIGYSALFGGALGGGFGAVSPIWKATMGGKMNSVLEGLTARLGGKEGVVPEAIDDAITKSGLDIPPEVRAATSSDPYVREMASKLEQTDTTQGGVDFQNAMQTARNDASKGITEALGKTEADLAGIKNQSDFEAGQTVQNQIAKEYKAISEPIEKAYQHIENKFKGIEVTDESKALMQENLAKAIEENGWKLLPDSEELKLTNRAMQGLNNVKTLEDLRKLQSNIENEAYRSELWKAKSTFKSVFTDGRESLLDSAIGNEAPELKAQFKQTQANYRELMNATDELNARLKVGNPSGPKDFLFKLGDQNPEMTLNRLGKSNDAGLLKFLQEKFPESANSVREFHINNILDKASETTATGAKLNSAKALKAIQNMSPELRQFALPAGATERTQAIQTFLKAIEDSNHNFSNTARTVDKLRIGSPGSAMAMVSWLTGHNPALGFLLEPLGKYLGKDVPDALRLSTLKFLGSKAPVEAGGFKAMVEFIHQVQKGEGMLNKAATGLFKGAKEVLPQTQMPSEKDRQKLDKRLKELQTDPHAMLNIGGSLGHYMPDHQTTLSALGMKAVNYLNSLRPATDRKNPLDSEIKPSKTQLAAYHNALDIAEQPLAVVQKIKDGSVTTQDLTHLKALYPSLYGRLAQKMSTEMMNALSQGENVAYKTRLGLSLFMGQPLDSTMTPQAIQATQASMHSMLQPPSQQGQQQHPKHSMNALNKFGMNEATSAQKREAQRSSRA